MKQFLCKTAITIGALSHSPNAFHCVDVVKVIDGDTVKIEVPSVHPIIAKLSLRIHGIDTPEKNGVNPCEKERSKEATEALTDFIGKGNRLDALNLKWGKYAGRVLGDLKVNGRDAGEFMLMAGLAVPYFGKKKHKYNWCSNPARKLPKPPKE